MSWWEAVLDTLGAVAVLAVLGLVALFVRRRWLSRRGGAFECSVRMHPPGKVGGPTAARGWMLGLGRYRGDHLEWFRTFSFSPRPKQTFNRSLTSGVRRTPHGAEAFSLYAGHLVVAVEIESSRRIELAMSERAMTGFLAWTEAAPPGDDRLLS